MNEHIELTSHPHIVKCKIINKADGFTLTLDKAEQIKSQKAQAAPSSVECNKEFEFTMSPHDELKYSTGGGDDSHIKIEFDDDDDCPKLKLGDALEGKDAKVGVETTVVERKEETETKKEVETKVTRSTGPPQPEFKNTKETEEETETGNVKTERKTKTKVEQSKKGTKTTQTEKTESKRKEVEVTWEIYSV